MEPRRTSHEMRNPLGAIIHCTDSIIASLTRSQELLREQGVDNTVDTETMKSSRTNGDSSPTSDVKHWRAETRQLIDQSIDSAETIISCAQHQKRIVDDILTMSKLDSKLLAATPITVNPIQMVRDAVKMFEVEARRVDIGLDMIIDDSWKALGMEYLDFDPSRVTQVLINLLTNALKFTKTGPTRSVTVGIGASRTRPTDGTSGVQYIPRAQDKDDRTYDQTVAGRGNPIFLTFEVKDTGKGLTDDEKKSLFQRFVQASSRTHVKYGGSGLGLFISRRLTELQNGAIGVASDPGVGSTFAFYIESYIPTHAALQEAKTIAEATQAVLTVSSNGKSQRAFSELVTAMPTNSEPTPHLLPTPTHSESFPVIKGVLVVEDNLINQQITRRHLISVGFKVDVANHGVECLDKLRLTDRFLGDDKSSGEDQGNDVPTAAVEETKPTEDARFPLSIILMDIEMPKMDGLTCTRRIRELEREGKLGRRRCPIIAVSANARVEQILEAKKAGCDDVLVKPYRMPELLEKMRLVIASLS
jgi:signal transduction histidine kinase/CheY-like chemotaxis protein